MERNTTLKKKAHIEIISNYKELSSWEQAEI